MSASFSCRTELPRKVTSHNSWSHVAEGCIIAHLQTCSLYVERIFLFLCGFDFNVRQYDSVGA